MYPVCTARVANRRLQRRKASLSRGTQRECVCLAPAGPRHIETICFPARCDNPRVDGDIGQILSALEAAWNGLEPDALAALFALDAVYVTRSGHVWRGRPAIEQGHADAFAGPLGDLILTLTPIAVIFPAPGVCVATVNVHLTDTFTRIRGIATLVLAGDGAEWHIISAHSTESAAIH